MKKLFLILLVYISVHATVNDFFQAVESQSKRVDVIQLLAARVASAVSQDGLTCYEMNTAEIFDNPAGFTDDTITRADARYWKFKKAYTKVTESYRDLKTSHEVQLAWISFALQKQLSSALQEHFKPEQFLSSIKSDCQKDLIVLYYRTIIMCAAMFNNAEYIENEMGRQWAPITWSFFMNSVFEDPKMSTLDGMYQIALSKKFEKGLTQEFKSFAQEFHDGLVKKCHQFSPLSQDRLLTLRDGKYMEHFSC